MVKKFTTNCDFGGQKTPVTLYIGDPMPGTHPFNFQGKWLGTRGGTIPADIMKSFADLAEIAEKHRVSFEELCLSVISELKSSGTLTDDVKQASALSQPKDK